MSSREQLDITLVTRCMEGDTRAFKDLIDTYKNVSLTLIYSILKDQIIAEDVLQDAFLKVYQKLQTFKQQSKFSTWLYRIVVNTAYNTLKQQKKHLNIETVVVLEGQAIEIPVNEYLSKTDQKKYINAALNTIKSDEALVLRLFYLYEHKIQEIKDITGFSISKIKIDLHRGRINMENQLQKLLGNEITNLL